MATLNYPLVTHSAAAVPFCGKGAPENQIFLGTVINCSFRETLVFYLFLYSQPHDSRFEALEANIKWTWKNKNAIITKDLINRNKTTQLNKSLKNLDFKNILTPESPDKYRNQHQSDK